MRRRPFFSIQDKLFESESFWKKEATRQGRTFFEVPWQQPRFRPGYQLAALTLLHRFSIDWISLGYRVVKYGLLEAVVYYIKPASLLAKFVIGLSHSNTRTEYDTSQPLLGSRL